MAYSSQWPCDDWLDADADAMWRKSCDEYHGDGGVAVARNDAHGLHFTDWAQAWCVMPMESAREVERRDAGQSDVILAFTADKSDMMPATASRSWDS